MSTQGELDSHAGKHARGTARLPLLSPQDSDKHQAIQLGDSHIHLPQENLRNIALKKKIRLKYTSRIFRLGKPD